jgi:hypothetical protein
LIFEGFDQFFGGKAVDETSRYASNAERARFELAVNLRSRQFSKLLPSTTRSPLHFMGTYACISFSPITIHTENLIIIGIIILF